MPAASCALPRQMLPPPTTTATETAPSRATSAIWPAIHAVFSTSTELSVPANASPEILRSTRP